MILTKDKKVTMCGHAIARIETAQIAAMRSYNNTPEEKRYYEWMKMRRRAACSRRLGRFISQLICSHQFEHIECNEEQGYDTVSCKLCHVKASIYCPDWAREYTRV